MWKRAGRSSALDRAQALLSANRNSSGDVESVQGSTSKTRGVVGGSVKSRSVPPNKSTLLSDLSDLSSVSSPPERGADTMGSAAAGRTKTGVEEFTEDLRPQSPLCGGGSRFLKKAPLPPTMGTQSPVSKSQMHQVPEPRNVSSSLRGSQTAAFHRLAQIESCIRSCKQAGQSLEASVHFSAQSSSDQCLKEKPFPKKNTTIAVNCHNSDVTRSPQDPDISVRPKSRAGDAVVPYGVSRKKSLRVGSGVSVKSDGEDMRTLLGDTLDLIDNSLLIHERPSSIRTMDKILPKSSRQVHSTPPPTAVSPPSTSNTAPTHSPASPSHRSSPFRLTGQSQSLLFGSPVSLRPTSAPPVLSQSPCPPCVSPSPMGSHNSPDWMDSLQGSFSSMSHGCEVLSLEELFPVGPGSDDAHSQISAVSSEDFKINVMTLDSLVPANLGFTEKTQGKEREIEVSDSVPGSPVLKEKTDKQQRQEEEEDVLDYQSDFESESTIEPDYSASQISEHLQRLGDEEEVGSEVKEEASDSNMLHERVADDYSNTFSDTSCSYSSWTSDCSSTLSRSSNTRSSSSSVSHEESKRHASTRKVLKEAAVQTQPDPLVSTWPTGMAPLPLAPSLSMAYMDPTPVVSHTLNAEMVEALSTLNPAAFALNELLKQQLAMMKRFIESSRHLHSSLVQSLEPPNYRYTTLEDTMEKPGDDSHSLSTTFLQSVHSTFANTDAQTNSGGGLKGGAATVETSVTSDLWY